MKARCFQSKNQLYAFGQEGSKMQFPKKITTSTCGLDVKSCEAACANGEKAVAVLNIVGTVSSSPEAKATPYGTSLKFTGEFQADNVLTGESYRSQTMFLPSCGEMALAPMLADVKQGEKVKFGLQILVSYQKPKNEKGTTFTWGVRNLIEPTQDDELAKMMKSITGSTKKVAAPKAAAGK